MTTTTFRDTFKRLLRVLFVGVLTWCVVGQTSWAAGISIVQVSPRTGVLASTGQQMVLTQETLNRPEVIALFGEVTVIGAGKLMR